jgi:uncharacterized protein (UPF0371 family)
MLFNGAISTEGVIQHKMKNGRIIMGEQGSNMWDGAVVATIRHLETHSKITRSLQIISSQLRI